MTGARITFSGLGSVWLDEAGEIDVEKLDSILGEHGVVWVEFGDDEHDRLLFDNPDLPKSYGLLGKPIADRAAEAAVREMVAKLYDDKRPAYRRIEFGGRHGGKMARMGRRG